MAISRVSPFGALAFPAGSASLQQFQLVALGTSGSLLTPGANGATTTGIATANIIGVLDDAPSTTVGTYTSGNEEYSGGFTVGVNYNVNIQDVPKVIFGGTVPAGAPVTSDASGHAIVASGTNTIIIGISLEAHVSGDVGPILIAPSIHP